jgi:hypothetical protein
MSVAVMAPRGRKSAAAVEEKEVDGAAECSTVEVRFPSSAAGSVAEGENVDNEQAEDTTVGGQIPVKCYRRGVRRTERQPSGDKKPGENHEAEFGRKSEEKHRIWNDENRTWRW